MCVCVCVCVCVCFSDNSKRNKSRIKKFEYLVGLVYGNSSDKSDINWAMSDQVKVSVGLQFAPQTVCMFI